MAGKGTSKRATKSGGDAAKQAAASNAGQRRTLKDGGDVSESVPSKTKGTESVVRGRASEIEPKPDAITRERIAAKAYELWERKGGDPESNWLEAERILRNNHGNAGE